MQASSSSASAPAFSRSTDLDLDILYTSAGPESIQAVIGGSIDIAVASGVSAAVGTFAKGAPIRILSSEMTGAPDSIGMFRPNRRSTPSQDLNGKTVSFSAVGSSSNAALLALIAQYHLTAKPQPTGNIAATITQTMTGQVDVGFGAAPFGLDLVEPARPASSRPATTSTALQHARRSRQSHRRADFGEQA